MTFYSSTNPNFLLYLTVTSKRTIATISLHCKLFDNWKNRLNVYFIFFPLYSNIVSHSRSTRNRGSPKKLYSWTLLHISYSSSTLAIGKPKYNCFPLLHILYASKMYPPTVYYKEETIWNSFKFCTGIISELLCKVVHGVKWA